MNGKKQSFFKQLQKVAAHLDRAKNLCKNTEFDYQSQTTCINSLKGYAEELQEKLVESKQLYEEQEASFVKFQSFLDLVEGVVDQQKVILQSQETFMEQYGYVSYEKSCSEKEEKTNGTQEPETASPTEENVSPEKTSKEVCADEESPQTPKLEDFGLSHYTMLKLQKPKISLNRPATECIATPTAFQHDGLFMSPSVWGSKMPSLYTPDVRNTTQDIVGWPESVASSAKKSAFQFVSSKRICKNLRMEMDNDDDDILNQCPSVPSLKTKNLDIYQLPPTPKSASKTVLKLTELAFGKPKDYLTEELPLPPKLKSKIQLPISHETPKDKSKTHLEALLSSRNTEENLDTPSPPLLHTTTYNFDALLSPDVAEPVLSCRSKKKDKKSYFERDVPEPPELTRVYRYSTRNKENRAAKK